MPKVIKSKVISIEDVNCETKKYIFELEKLVVFEAGQFLQLTLEDVTASEYWPESRAFSIASKNDDNRIELYIKRTGEFTSMIHRCLKIGDPVSLKLPYGDFVLPSIENKSKIVCISNGVGITPFLSFIDFLWTLKEIDRFYLFHSARFSNDLIGIEKL